MSFPKFFLFSPNAGGQGTVVLLTCQNFMPIFENGILQTFDDASKLHGTAASRVDSLVGYGARIAGADSYFDDPNFLGGESHFGLHFWVKADLDLIPLTQDTTLFFRGTAGGGDIRLMRYSTNRAANAGRLALELKVMVAGTPRMVTAIFNAKLQTGKWTALAVSMAFGQALDGLSYPYPKLYLDGLETDRSALYGLSMTELATATAMASGGGESVFGAALDQPGVVAHYEFADAVALRGAPLSGGNAQRIAKLPTILFDGTDVTPARYVNHDSAYFTVPYTKDNAVVTVSQGWGTGSGIFAGATIQGAGEGSFFHLWPQDGIEELALSCNVNVEVPVEHLDDSFLYTVQNDDRTYSSGSFVEQSTIFASSLVKMKLTVDSTNDAGLLQRFFLENPIFFIKTDHLDLFLDGAATPKAKCRLISYENEGRDSPTTWKASLSIQRLEK